MSNIVKDIKNKIKEKPAGVFSLVYIYVLIIGLVIGIHYVNNENYISRRSVPPALPDTTKVVDLKVSEAKVVPAADINLLAQPTDSLIKAGENIFQSTCVSCHGTEGKGNGPVASGLKPPPRNFTSKEGWVNGPKLTQIYQTLQEGVEGSAMASYQQLSPTEKFEVAHYIRSTFVPDPPEDTKEDLATLDQTYNLSAGKRIPATIPVAAAMKIIEEESQPKSEKITQVIQQVSRDANSEGARIFNQVTNNKSKALTILLGSDNWRQSEKDFVDIIVYNTNVNGFNGKVYSLSGDEWDALFNYMNKNL